MSTFTIPEVWLALVLGGLLGVFAAGVGSVVVGCIAGVTVGIVVAGLWSE